MKGPDVFAAISSGNTDILFVLLAILAFGVAIYLAYVHNYIGAIIAAFIGVVILVLTAGA